MGPLGERAEATLLAAAAALIGAPIDTAHYAEFFRWRSENLPGHRALYERFTRAVNRAANRSSDRVFAECSSDVRTRILHGAFRVRDARGRLSRLRVGVFQRDWLLFDRHIIRETLLLFSRTDVWRVVGYEAWPATARGLDRYRRSTAERSP